MGRYCIVLLDLATRPRTGRPREGARGASSEPSRPQEAKIEPEAAQVDPTWSKKSILERFWDDFSWILVPKSVPKRLRRKAIPESFFEGVFEGFFDDLPRFPVELAFLQT